MMSTTRIRRCPWADDDPLLIEYHDREWGVPVHDDRRHFEFLILEGTQAGLSWKIILRKRAHYRKVYSNFDPLVISHYNEAEVMRLMADPGIVRNSLKIRSAIINAKKFLEVQREFGSFDSYVWQFVQGKPIRHTFTSMSEIPPKTKESDALSEDLKKRGFKFVGSTICYAFMQAVGMVNDHMTDCYRYNAV